MNRNQIRFAILLATIAATSSTFSSATGTVGFTTSTTTPWCFIGPNGQAVGDIVAISGWYYIDSSGVTHTFSGTSYIYASSATNGCNNYTTGFTATSPAKGGYYIITTNGNQGTVSVSATVFPKYQILSLLYDAPGNQSSSGFTDTTFYGTTNSVGSSFSSGVSLTFTAGGGIFGIGGGTSASVSFTQGYGTTNAFTNTITNGQTLTLKSSRNQVDHKNDTFWIWLNPQVTVTAAPGASTAATYAISTPSGQVMDAVRASVAQLETPSTIPLAVLEPITINGVVYPGLSNICAHPLPVSQCTQTNACGCVADDFAPIRATDPIISISSNTPPSQIDTNRYFPLNPPPSPFPFLEYGTTDQITLTDQNQSAQTQTETTTYQTTFSTQWGSTFSSAPVDWNLQWRVTDTFTWTQSVSLTNFNGTSHQMAVSLGTSTSGCDEAIDVFEDYNYHTFVAVPAATPPIPCDSN